MEHKDWEMTRICENCEHWGSITWKCVHPKGHRNNETVDPDDTCEYFELDRRFLNDPKSIR
jgi:hypothetical protein